MRMYDIIEKKRDGKELSQREIQFAITGITDGTIPDYQISALLMAIYFQEMTNEEQVDLTKAMVESGKQIDLSPINGVKVDKHSTGGVGDTTTIILAPLVASVGAPVAKMSGRGLGHTGGTLDKLEAISGFNIEMTNELFIQLVNQNHIAVIGQSDQLTPADKNIYRLRDVTATVNSIPLIASSIMSKKIASGADAIVLDVKTGSGAFMKDVHQAKLLAQEMVAIGNEMDRNTMAVISDMNQPLGHAVGNALEIKEAIETLQGNGPDDLTELCLTIGSQMVYLAGKASSLTEARNQLEVNLHNGKALNKFATLIQSQGGDARIIREPDLLPTANYQIPLPAQQSGTISSIAAEQIGVSALLLGAGRMTAETVIDLAVGITLHKKIGDYVEKGEPLLTIHSNTEDIDDVKGKLYSNITISDQTVNPPLLIYETVTT